uniref:G-protein coupled receptors family 1 profile domain-containing protein n=2 Tax=Oryzias melastigma TaxID=30732 RepID=A0A3B3BFS8_ORYME
METSSVFTSNTSSSPGHLHPSSWDFQVLTQVAVLSLGFLLGFPGNIAVIILKPNIHNLSPVSQSLMLNLAVSDLLFLLTIPFWIYDVLFSWTFGLVPCKLLTFSIYFSVFVSGTSVTLLSVQRYLVVVKQRNTLNRLGPKRLLVLLWITSFIAATPVCVIRPLTLDNQRTYCTFQLSTEAPATGVLIVEASMGFTALFIVAFSYISLYKKVNQAGLFNHPQTNRLVSSISVSFFVLNFPYFLINVLSVFAVSLRIQSLLEFCRNSRNIFATITIFNCCLNPFLYTFTSCNFWKCTEKRNCCGRNSDVSQSQSNISINITEK